MKPTRILRPVLLILGCLMLLACSPPAPETPAPVTPSPVVMEPTDTVEPSEAPSPPPTLSTGVVVLLAQPGADSGLLEGIQAILEELAASEGLNFRIETSLDLSEIENDLRILVALPPDPGLESLATAVPGVQFVGIGITGLEPGNNLSVISAQGSRPDQQGFLAGYLAALVTPDWRVGALSVSDTPAGTAARQGFLNGVIFFCGLCRPTYPPYLPYPTYAELPSSASPSEWLAAADTLLGSSVQTIFLAPGAGDESLPLSLAQAGVNLIGSAPPPPAIKDHWVATVSVDLGPALRQLWPNLLAGNGGADLSPSIQIGDVNADLLSQGRQRLVEELMENLQGGFIDTGVNATNPAVP